MLIEFSVGNYRSFKDPVTFSMVAAKLHSQDKSLDENTVIRVDDDLSLLSSAALYGPNASGKSNFIDALDLMRGFVLTSSKDTQVNDKIPVERFRLSTNTQGQPSYFQIVFLADGKQYRYGFEATTERIVREWLYHVPTIREALLFERDTDAIKIKTGFKEGRGLQSKTRPNALFLSVAAQFNGEIATRILQRFRMLNILWGLNDGPYYRYTIDCFEMNINKEAIIRLIKKLDLGIANIQIERTALTKAHLPPSISESIKDLLTHTAVPEQKTVKVLHHVFNERGEAVSDETFDAEHHESEGTLKLFALAGPLMKVLETGTTLFVDELDARLHPLVTSAIIGLFNSKESNPNHAQLIFTTHDTNLLDPKTLRRDQIWFAEKDRWGATHLYSLAEYKVRNDAAYEKNYIEGRYGAIPFIGDLSRLLGEAHA